LIWSAQLQIDIIPSETHSMKHHLAPLMLIVAVATVEHGLAQSVQSPDATPNGAVLTKLSDPTYPPLARQARITGDVDLMLTIRQDGSVESAVLVSGHPMLTQAVLDSARRSQFECSRCAEGGYRYPLKYKFGIISQGYPKDCDMEKDPPAAVDSTRHEISVSSWAMMICDPSTTIIRARSAKCLYLWRCGTHDKD
jgi:TonB family protein